MKQVSPGILESALDWCRTELDLTDSGSDQSREHGHRISATRRVTLKSGTAYLKVHTSRAHWEAEVHGYEQWAKAFGTHAPRLLAVHDEPPLSLVVSEIGGTVLEETEVTGDQEQSIWRSAGEALTRLHDIGGSHFGKTDRRGTPEPDADTDPVAHLTRRFSDQIERAHTSDLLNDTESAVVQQALALIPSFADERPTACHRDYCAANWIVDATGNWAGVIDFEFSHWDIRVADFTRDAHWTWLRRPHLVDAFFEGYGQNPEDGAKEQMRFAHVEYALGAIVWGHDNEYFGFAREGREALEHLATRG